MEATASKHPPTTASRPNSGKLIEDKPEGAKEGKSWPPLLVAQGCFELSPINGNEVKRFHATSSSFTARVALPPLLDLAPFLDLQNLVRTC